MIPLSPPIGKVASPRQHADNDNSNVMSGLMEVEHEVTPNPDELGTVNSTKALVIYNPNNYNQE